MSHEHPIPTVLTDLRNKGHGNEHRPTQPSDHARGYFSSDQAHDVNDLRRREKYACEDVDEIGVGFECCHGAKIGGIGVGILSVKTIYVNSI